jgi:hypothetical protein
MVRALHEAREFGSGIKAYPEFGEFLSGPQPRYPSTFRGLALEYWATDAANALLYLG